jgi:dienelactone hydrolase
MSLLAVALLLQGTPGGDAVLDALRTRAKEVLAAHAPPADRASCERAVPLLRTKLRAALGLDRLGPPLPRNLRRVGTIDRGGYVIDKLVYETLPGAEVPAHLYRPPRAERPLPAVLFVPGHWYADSKTKTDFQAFCAAMALRGFMVLAYDPIGQGERGISLRDHRRTELLAGGVSQQAIVDFESLCALEVLFTHPGVDPSRVGMTGASGGGFNSWIVPALDGRVAATAPVVGTSEFLEQIDAVRERDWYDAKEHCHFVPGLLRFANNHELLAMVAPRPLLIVAAHDDHSFRIPGNRAVAEYGRRLYAALGAADRIGYFEDAKEAHGYHRAKREAVTGWFLKWLKGEGDGSPAAEPGLELPSWDAPELRCFPEHRPAGPALVALAKRLLEPPARPDVTRAALAEALGLPSADVPDVEVVRSGDRLRWTMPDGVEIPARLRAPGGDWKGAVLATADAGSKDLDVLLDAGWAVVEADPRGLGALATGKPGWTYAVSLLLGENFTGRQALDLAAGVRALRRRPELAGKPVGLVGDGPAAALAALYAAVLEPQAAWLATRGGFGSYRAFVERGRAADASFLLGGPGDERRVPADREIPASLVVFDVFRRFDLPDLHAALAPRRSLGADPIGGDLEPLGPAGDFPARLRALAEGR